MEVIFTHGVQPMPVSPSAQIKFPLDIPQVDVLGTKQTQDGQFSIKSGVNVYEFAAPHQS